MRRLNGLVKRRIFSVVCCLACCSLYAQHRRVELLKYGELDKWMVREIKESLIIGGDTKYLYEVTEGDTLKGNVPYKSTESPWATSSVLAKVSGVVKTSLTVFPEKRGEGYCARLETRLEHCKVLGLFNIRVLASGTIFLGEMVEPVKDTKNPQSKLVSGIEFTGRPVALVYDYKVITGGQCRYVPGFGRSEVRAESDMAETSVLLQKRWEDEAGNVYAKRVATGWERFDKSQEEWQNGHRLKLRYGDISREEDFEPYMGLVNGEHAYYTRNSKGQMVPIQESGWADAEEEPTHIVLRMSSSNGGAYIGNTDSKFWVDNVGLEYEDQ
ncbi:PCMD domain-containing protein [Odoribacter lunatus]|uniref:PCMD domain-containing protein n=1 Tax=Odoribacter lunatus TaxID=2941335 RepID=UPI00203F13B4|nr:PCMD domain-containing protein [Odoribacter lunatus]